MRQYKNRQSPADTPTANYDVEMETVKASELIRSAYGAFWRKPRPGKAKPQIPPILAHISITICQTFSTRIRVRILKQMAKRHQEANPDLNVFVTNFLPRPTLKVRQQGGGRVSTYTYVEAVKRFGHHLTRDFLVAEASYARPNVPLDCLTPYFLVLSPDMVQKSNPQTPPSQGPARSKPVKRGLEQEPSTASKKSKGKARGKGGKAAKATGAGKP